MCLVIYVRSTFVSPLPSPFSHVRAKSTLVDVYLQTRRCRAPVMSPCLHSRLFESAGSQSVYSRQTQPSRLHPLSYQREDFLSRSGCVVVDDDDPSTLGDRAVILAMLSAKKLSASGEIGIPDESRKTKVETVKRGLVIASDCRSMTLFN